MKCELRVYKIRAYSTVEHRHIDVLVKITR